MQLAAQARGLARGAALALVSVLSVACGSEATESTDRASVAATAGIIGNLVVDDTTNAASWSVQSNLAVGATQYGDRTYTLTSVPSAVAGAAWIRTANASKAFAGTTVATFTVNADADVYVAYNDSIATKPSWLSTFADSGQNLVNSESTPKTF